MASYTVNRRAVERARRLIGSRQYVLDSDWGEAQPTADDENAFLASHSWDEFAEWHLGLTEGATDETKARYAFVYGDFRRIHRRSLTDDEVMAPSLPDVLVDDFAAAVPVFRFLATLRP